MQTRSRVGGQNEARSTYNRNWSLTTAVTSSGQLRYPPRSRPPRTALYQNSLLPYKTLQALCQQLVVIVARPLGDPSCSSGRSLASPLLGCPAILPYLFLLLQLLVPLLVLPPRARVAEQSRPQRYVVMRLSSWQSAQQPCFPPGGGGMPQPQQARLCDEGLAASAAASAAALTLWPQPRPQPRPRAP